jgi:hypothetical protein
MAVETPSTAATLPMREAVASFADRRQFVNAVTGLLGAGFERADLSVLASHQSLEIAGDVPGYPGRPDEALAASLVGEARFLVPLTIAGVVFLSGGPIAAALAVLVGAGLGGAALKELLARLGANRHSADFAVMVAAGAVLLWVKVESDAATAKALAILEGAGGRHAHVQMRAPG